MRSSLATIPRLAATLKRRGFLLMLDFDGVLAPIVRHPNRACMSSTTRRLLAACAKRGRVAVITGRSLKDVRRRVALPGIWYAGNHGAEWSMGKVHGRQRLHASERAALRKGLEVFRALAPRFPGVVVEDKGVTFSVHFRSLSRSRVPSFRRAARRRAAQFPTMLDVREGAEYIFNARVSPGKTKGDAVRLARKLAPQSALPVYVGDDATDEDAFEALPRGLTIRVGTRSKTAARFFLNSRADVDGLLKLLARG